MKNFNPWFAGSLLGLLLASVSPILSLGQETGDNEADRKISPSDILVIEVFGERDFSRELRVQKSGIITYPFLGNVEVAGKTPPQVEQLLQTRLGEDYLVDPIITVTVKEYRLQTVLVLGQVIRAGAIELPAEQKIDIVEAIARAGGLAPNASEKIELTRDGKTTVYRLDALRRIKDDERRIWLKPGDLIMVKERFF